MDDFGFGSSPRDRTETSLAPNSSEQLYVIGLQRSREIGRASTWTSGRTSISQEEP